MVKVEKKKKERKSAKDIIKCCRSAMKETTNC